MVVVVVVMVDRNGRDMESVVGMISQVAQPGKGRSKR